MPRDCNVSCLSGKWAIRKMPHCPSQRPLVGTLHDHRYNADSSYLDSTQRSGLCAGRLKHPYYSYGAYLRKNRRKERRPQMLIAIGRWLCSLQCLVESLDLINLKEAGVEQQ